MGTNQTTNISKKWDLQNSCGLESSQYLDSLPTFNKLCLAQNLLKEMYSLKERFEDKQNKMICEIEQNCYKYYKNKLSSKEIYDYFESNNLEERIIYKLTNNSKYILDNQIYKAYYDLLFILRNNNSLIIHIINKCEPKYYKDLSDFIVHFLYEDTSNCSFLQEELLLIIYLYIENIMFTKLPLKLTSSTIRKERDLYINKINDKFIYFLFNSLTRKFDIRAYFSSFLSDLIFRIEEENKDNLMPEPKKLLEEIKESDIDNDWLEISLKKNKSKENILETNKENIILKNNKRFKETIRNSIIKLKKRMSVGALDLGVKSDASQNQKLIKIDEKDSNEIKIDKFFNEEDIDYTYICDKLNYYENIKEKNSKIFAIIEYLDLLLNEITKDGEPVEVFSTIVLKNEIRLIKINESTEIYDKLIKKIKSNYDYITCFISTLLIKLKENINSIPFSLKCIFKIIDELYNKKYQNIKVGVFNYQLLMIKARILFGCMIIPMLSNPNSSGIYTDGIISKLTKNNLDIVANILKIVISGNLFLVENASHTIFNKFIIDTIPNIFDIILDLDNINKNINLPNFINKLISDFPDKIGEQERNINYDYFNEKANEKIQFQSICFSWKDFFILLNIIKKNEDIFIDKNSNNEEKTIFERIFLNANINNKYLENYKENKNKNVYDFYFITKLLYQKEFEERLNAILKDNFEILFRGQENDEVIRFKKCLSEVLAYVNYLHREDFVTFLKDKTNIIIEKNSNINKYFNYKRKLKYESMNFEKKSKDVKTSSDLINIKKNLKKVKIQDSNLNKFSKDSANFILKRRSSIYKVVKEIKEDIDFKDIIFPQIASKVLSEIYFNPVKGNSQRILFCITYLQDNINDLPQKYVQNNFKQIFVDILGEPENLIKELQYNILNEFHLKIRNSEKLNLISSKDSVQIKNMERYSYTGYLFNKIKLKGNLKKSIVNKKIQNIELELNDNSNKSNQLNFNLDSIQSFINEMPKLRDYELEKKLKINEIINNYFKEIKDLVKEEKIVSKFSSDDLSLINNELENYILIKLYDKLYPIEETNEDKFFYRKCKRLSFIKPENIIKNKNMINEKLLDIAINYISEMDRKLTPVDKIKVFVKAIDILKNSIRFNSGKSDLGLDDTLPFLIYIILKSKQEKIYTNYNYCNLFLNPEFSKKQFGNILTQLNMFMNIIKNMKYNELIGITEEQFGKDE